MRKGVRRDERGHALVGPRRLRPLPRRRVVKIEARARLAAQPSRLHERGDHGRRLDAVTERLVEHQAGVERRVEPDHVVQLERPHRHAERPGHAVDPPRVDPRPEHLDRLVQIRHQQPVDEEAGAVTDHDGAFPEPLHVGDRRGDRGVGRGGPADHLDERHPPHRIEEMDPAEPGRVAEGRGELGDRIRGGVGGDHGPGPHRALDLGEHLPLDVGALDDALDDQIGGGERRQLRGGAQPAGQRERPYRIGALRGPVPGGLVEDPGDRPFEHRGIDVHERDLEAVPHVTRGDAGSHDARADDGRPLDRGGVGRSVVVAAADARVATIALPEPEHADELPRHVAGGERGEGRRLQPHRLGGVGPDAGERRPQDRRGRRVVAVGAAEDDRRDDRLQESALGGVEDDRGGEPPPAGDVAGPGGGVLDESPGGRERRLLGHAGIDDTEPPGRRCVDRLTTGRKLDCRAGADQPGEADGAAPAGQQAQLDFGQSERGVGRGGGDAEVAGQGEFEASPEADAVDQGHARPRGLGEPAENAPAGGAGLLDLRGRTVGEPFDPPQVSPGEERSGPGRTQHQAAGRLASLEGIQRRVEVTQHPLGDHVEPVIGHQEREDDDAVWQAFDRDGRRIPR